MLRRPKSFATPQLSASRKHVVVSFTNTLNKYAFFKKKLFLFFHSFFLLSFTFRYPLVSDRTPVQLLDPGTIIHSREFGSWYHYWIRYSY